MHSKCLCKTHDIACVKSNVANNDGVENACVSRVFFLNKIDFFLKLIYF
jgi:hypothetical protein